MASKEILHRCRSLGVGRKLDRSQVGASGDINGTRRREYEAADTMNFPELWVKSLRFTQLV